MTLLELTLALFIVGVLGVAVAAMTAGASDAWTTRNHYRQQVSDSRIIQHRIADLVRGSRRVIAAYDAGAGRYADVLLWADDEYFPGQVNVAELALITCDTQTQRLTLSRIELTDAQKQQIALNPAVNVLTVGTTTYIGQLRSSQQAISYTLAEGVLAFDTTLGAGDDVAYRFVEMKLTLAGTPQGQPLTQVIAAYVRAPDRDVTFAAGGTP